MVKKLMIVFTVALLLMPSCKRDTWIDWRIQNQLWIENVTKQNPNKIQTTPTGLRYEVRYAGKQEGKRPDNLKSVVISYTGSLINGNVFDTGENDTLAVSDLISGFAEGLKKMTPSDHYILYIPYNLGYGEDGTGTEGAPRYIPPYSTLIFDVTLKQVL